MGGRTVDEDVEVAVLGLDFLDELAVMGSQQDVHLVTLCRPHTRHRSSSSRLLVAE